MTISANRSRAPIAVVGVSALFPGSLDATGFWRDILEGTDRITDVPPSHWLIDDYYDPDPAAPDKTYARRGAFLRDIDFDALAWGVPPSIVPETDTSQLLALIVAQRVLEDATAGRPDTLDRSRISVILGVTSGQELLGDMVSRLQRPVWIKSLRESGIPEAEAQAICDRIASHYTPWNESNFPGLLGNVVAGRIANRLDLGGTNCVTDAACASTFSALSMAMQELQLGDSDMVITGGVDTMNNIFMFMCFSKTPALSPTGDCRPFSDQADGTMLGEGIGMVALKRLADAERDGDTIYAVIDAVGASSDGRAKSVYAPRAEGQSVALRRAYALAGYGPDSVELLEAHGTGTKAGDAAEFEGVRTVFDEAGRTDRQWCTIGSVKSQIGHTKAAAGAAGLVKAVMALHHKVLPPTIKVERPNPALQLEQSPFHVSTSARPWVRASDHPRRAAVSSFGFGGSNFHVVLSEYDAHTAGARAADRLRTLPSELVLLCGDHGASLATEARRLLADSTQPGFLAWLAYNSQQSFRADAPVRLALVASDEADLQTKLRQAADTITAAPDKPFSTPTGIHYGTGSTAGKIAFLFSGQGSQALHMGSSLAMHFPAALQVWDAAADLQWDNTTTLARIVFPPTAFGTVERTSQEQHLAATEWAQPAIGCTSVSMLALLDAVGLRADVVAGHSFGEVTALHAAGVLSQADFLAVARRRGELMRDAAATPGAMLAVAEPIERVRELLARWGHDVVVANHNGPTQIVLSGRTEEIEKVAAQCAAAGITSRRLAVATAFHSPVVASAGDAFATFLGGIAFAAPNRPVFSNTSATQYPTDPNAIRAALAAQIANPVRFVEMIEAMYEHGVRTFVEVGPGAVQTGLVAAILEGRPHHTVSLDRKGKDGVRSFLGALAALATEGRALDLGALWAGYAVPTNPHDRAQPKFSVAINGANYGKPYPPPGGTAALPKPNPPRVEPLAPPAPAPLPIAAAAPPPSPAMQPLVDAQIHVGQVHAVYLQTMAETHTAFLDMVERTLTPRAAAGASEVLAAPRPRPAAVPLALPTQPHVASIGVPAAIVAPPVAAPPAPTLSVPPPPALDLRALMLAVVADKTGYPAEMLTMEMELEGDLGIDSIKRVEILSSMTDRVPGLPEFETAVLAKLHTLGEVVDYMNETLGSAPSAPTAAVSAPPAAAPDVDLRALMLAVVADKTGYPAEMLTMEMELEGDLGIDSIKRVEILSSMTDRVPGLPEFETAVLAKLRTLGEVVDYMNRTLGLTAAESTVAAPTNVPAHALAPPPATAPALGRYTLAAVDAPALGMAQSGVFGRGPILITADGTDLPQQLVTALTRRGIEALAVDDTASADDRPNRGLIFLGGLRAVASVDAAIAVNREAFAAARGVAAAMEAAKTGDAVFVTVQDTGGSFGTNSVDPTRAWLSGCAALARTLRQEWPGVAVKGIDLERGDRTTSELAEAIADELACGGPDTDVGLTAGGRRLVLRSTAVDVVAATPVLVDGDVVVASGGARGVTAATLIALAGEARLRFVLLGRTEVQPDPACCAGLEGDAALKRALLADAATKGDKPTPAALGATVAAILASREIRATLSAMKVAGSEARYLVVDVADAGGLSTALTAVRADWGSIAAVIHGAGVLADKRLVEKTPAQFDRVFNTKVLGLRALLAATATDPLKVLCLFSSVAARCGNVGQCDYAMANEILNKVAVAEARRRGDRCVVKALGWGPWEGGMVSPQLRAHFEALGVPLIPLAVGAHMMSQEIAGAATHEVELVLGGAPRAEALLPSGEPRSLLVEVMVGRDSHPYLSDHAIHGTPVVPVALVVEWFSRLARAFVGGDLVLSHLRNLDVLRGIPLRHFAETPERLVLRCRETTPASEDGVNLNLELADTADRVYYRCTAKMVRERTAPTASVEHHGRRGQDLAFEDWQAAPVYDGKVLFHGPDFQMIQSIDGISDHGILAGLSGVRDSTHSTAEPWCTDPLIFDGGLQLALLWCRRVLGGASLPTSIAEIRSWSDDPSPGPFRCTLTGRSATGRKSVSDAVFQDGTGRIVAALTGIETHLLPDQGATPPLS